MPEHEDDNPMTHAEAEEGLRSCCLEVLVILAILLLVIIFSC